MKRDQNLIPLSHDHQRSLALCVLVRRSLAQDSSAANLALLAQKILEVFQQEIGPHFALEEAALFPVAAEAEPLNSLVAELIAEHKQMLAMVDQLRTSVTAPLIQEFCQTLERHIRKEERLLFEQMQQLQPGRLAQLAMDRAHFPSGSGCDRLGAKRLLHVS